MTEETKSDVLTTAPAPRARRAFHVSGGMVIAFVGLAGGLTTAVELLPPGPWWIASKIALAGVLAAGGAAGMWSSGRK